MKDLSSVPASTDFVPANIAAKTPEAPTVPKDPVDDQTQRSLDLARAEGVKRLLDSLKGKN